MSSPSCSVAEATPRAAEARPAEKSTYGQILKSSALIGGSSALNIAIGIVRTKVMAVLLGPSGFGLFGLYGSISDLSVSIAGMGVNSSGVRQIAESVGSGDIERIARTTTVLRRVSILLGLLGALFLVVFSPPVSRLTFGSDKYAGAVSLLSLAVFFRLVSAGQGALIQGMRRIADLAKMSILGALFGLVLSIPLVYFFRENGIVASLVGVGAMTILTSWWYSRRIEVPAVAVNTRQASQEVAGLLKLGFAFMASAFLTMGAAYAVRIILVHQVGMEATGYYQSAWTLGGLYVGFILQAMGADFYPRLTAHANDNAACNRIVNEQAEVGLLLAGPGVIATLTFAPLVIALFYSARFHAAVDVLRWICLGTLMQVISWPMGFIILAKGRQNLFLLSDLAWTIVYLGLAWACVKGFGLNGAGIAFFGSYVFHGFLTYAIVRPLSGFGWSSENKRTGSLVLALLAAVFCGFYVLPFTYAACVGIVAAVLSGAYSLQRLVVVLPPDRVPSVMRRFFSRRNSVIWMAGE
ncbi:MAG TPA: O-antigen translocase [Bryobacteraceae bacterium]